MNPAMAPASTVDAQVCAWLAAVLRDGAGAEPPVAAGAAVATAQPQPQPPEQVLAVASRHGVASLVHERLRVHSQAAARRVKEEGAPNDLVERIASDPAFQITKAEIQAILEPERFVGRSAEQVDAFLAECIDPLLAQYADELAGKAEVNV